MLTCLRPRRSPNFTTPSAVEKSGASPPRPPLPRGYAFVPRWRTRIEPAVTAAPSNRFTPRRCAAESRPLRVDPPPFVLDMSDSSDLPGRRDGGDLQRGVVLAVAPPTTLVRLALVGHGVDLRAHLGADDLGRDRGAGQLRGRGQHGGAVDDQHGLERPLRADGLPEQLDADTLALGHTLLLASGPDDGVQ